MAIKTINVGVKPNDGTGDPNRDAFIKANDNFQELFSNTDAAQVATDAEALQGIDDLRRMTPAKVRKFVESFVGSAGRKAIEFFATATERDAINASLAATNTTVAGLATAVQGAAAGNRTAELWTALSAKAGDREYQPATVPDTDTGTHVDPVTGTTVPNAGEYRWAPQGWRWVSANASAVKRLAAGTVLSSLSTQRFAVIAADGATSGLISFTDLLTQILGEIMPKQTTFDRQDVAGTGVKELIPDDITITRAFFQNLSTTAFIAIAQAGKTPVLNKVGRTLGPGVGFEFNPVAMGAISVIASEDNVPVAFDFSNTSGEDPVLNRDATNHIKRYSATLTTPQQTAVRTLYKKFVSTGLFAKGGRVGVLAAPNLADAALIWSPVNSGSYAVLSAPVASWAGTTFDGVDDAFDLGVLLSAISGANDHTVMVWSDANDALQGTGKYAIGDSGTRVGPNRTATQASLHDLSSAQAVTVGAKGGLVGVTRTGAGKFIAHRNNDFSTEVTVTDAAAGTSTLYVGAIHVASGWSNGYAGKLKFFYAGPSLTADQRNAVYLAVNEYLTAVAGF